MRLKLDENLGTRGAELFLAAGHDVATVVEQGLASAVDHKLIAACKQEGRALITLDLDFANPLMFKPAEYAGIVVLRLPPKTTSDDLFDAIRTLLRGIEQKNLSGKLWVVGRNRIREYLPEQKP